MTAAVQEARDAVPLDALQRALAAGVPRAAEAELEAALDAFEGSLAGSGDLRAAATKARAGLPSVLGEAMRDGAAAVPLCATAKAVSIDAPAPTTAEAAEQMRGTFESLSQQLAERRIRVKLPPPAHLNPATAKGRAKIGIVHTGLRSTLNAIDAIEARGLKIGRRKIKLGFKKLGDQTLANAHMFTNTVTINYESSIWVDRARLTEAARGFNQVGWLASGSADGTMTHEIGHIFHSWSRTSASPVARSRVIDFIGELDQSDAVVARKVSRYGATTKVEFVAETFSGLVEGRRYTDDVMALYERLLGPKVTR